MASPANAPQSGPSPDGSGVYNPAAGFLNSECRRTLGSPVFTASQTTSIDLPKDTVIKRIDLSLAMSQQVTFASGSPVFQKMGALQAICSQIVLRVGGVRTIKSIRPFETRMLNTLIAGVPPRRSYLDTSSAPTTARGAYEWLGNTTLASVATTHYISFEEMISIYLENPFGYGGSRQMTELDLRDVSSATLDFSWGTGIGMTDESSAAWDSVASTSVSIIPQLIENRARPRPVNGQPMYDYVESYIANNYTAQGSQQVLLPTGDFIMALGITCRNGDSGYTLQENLLKNIELKVNTANSLQGPVSHSQLQDSNKSRFGIDDSVGVGPIKSSIASLADSHNLRGYALMSLIRNGDWNTALASNKAAGVDSVVLKYDTPASSGTDAATYTNGLKTWVTMHSIRPFTYSR